MFYVSSVKDEKLKVGVTDTKDRVEEFYTNEQLCKFIQNGITIFGTDYYNHYVTCKPLTLNQTPDRSKLLELLEVWKKVHNQWNGRPVEDYLASLRAGSYIKVDYIYRTTSGTHKKSCTELRKKDYDTWLFTDVASTFSGSLCDSKLASGYLDIAFCCGRCTGLEVK